MHVRLVTLLLVPLALLLPGCPRGAGGGKNSRPADSQAPGAERPAPADEPPTGKSGEPWGPSSYMREITKSSAELFKQNRLKLTGHVGGAYSYVSEERSAHWSGYRHSVFTPAEADQAVRAVHRELWQLVQERGWDVRGLRELPANERTFRFDLSYVADGTEGRVAVSLTPDEGGWEGEQERSCKLEIRVSESGER